MTDLEITRLCAEAMGLELNSPELPMAYRGTDWYDYKGDAHETWIRYDPLNHDAQAMALVKHFWLACHWNFRATEPRWEVTPYNAWLPAFHEDLNRAIVECVAKMQAAK